MSRHAPGFLAPGASDHGLYAPGRGESRPRIDDRLAPPEARLEYLDGVEIFAAPADLPHAVQHFDLSYILGGHVAPGYLGAVDMLTRTDAGSDVAPDASIFPAHPDLRTGGRQLEELAFEVCHKQALAVPTEKARKLVARGVRRVFCILVPHQRVLEWSRETDGWKPLPPSASIEDPCLVRPLRVADLLDGSRADDAVLRALLDKGVPALQEALAKSEARGEAIAEVRGAVAAGRAALLTVLRSRKISVSKQNLERIEGCISLKDLERWLRRAATATTEDDVFKARPKRKKK